MSGLKTSKYHRYVWSKISPPTIHVLFSPPGTKKVTKPVIYKFRVFIPTFRVWSKNIDEKHHGNTSCPLLSSTRRNQRSKGYQFEYNIYIQIIITHVPCVQILIPATDVLCQEAPESIKSPDQIWYLYSKRVHYGSCLVQTLLQKYQHTFSCPRLLLFARDWKVATSRIYNHILLLYLYIYKILISAADVLGSVSQRYTQKEPFESIWMTVYKTKPLTPMRKTPPTHQSMYSAPLLFARDQKSHQIKSEIYIQSSAGTFYVHKAYNLPFYVLYWGAPETWKLPNQIRHIYSKPLTHTHMCTIIFPPAPFLFSAPDTTICIFKIVHLTPMCTKIRKRPSYVQNVRHSDLCPLLLSLSKSNAVNILKTSSATFMWKKASTAPSYVLCSVPRL